MGNSLMDSQFEVLNEQENNHWGGRIKVMLYLQMKHRIIITEVASVM